MSAGRPAPAARRALPPGACSAAWGFIALPLLFACGDAMAEPLRYSGTLVDAGMPADGRYAMRLALYDSASGWHRIGRQVTLDQVDVARGGFALQADFGMPLATLRQAWLQVEVAGPDGRFESLGERALVDAKALAGGACWATSGNAGTSPTIDFLGTTDLAALELRVGGERALRFDPDAISPNLLGGSRYNQLGTVRGATIAGGGTNVDGDVTVNLSGPNRVHDNYGSIGGGVANVAGTFGNGSQFAPTVAGGSGNVASNTVAAVGGGQANQATGIASSIGGGNSNTASGPYGSIAGGQGNTASGSASAVLGGDANTASRPFAVVAGGESNSAHADHAFVAGGELNQAGGDNSFAAGSHATVRSAAEAGNATGDAGTFVWSDAQPGSFASSGANQFLLRAGGGVGINRVPASVDVELTIEGRANDAFQGNVDLVFIPSANGASGEGIAIATGLGGAGTNDAIFTIAQRNNSQFVSRFRIDSDGTTRNTSGAWSTLSDARVKHSIEAIPSPLRTLLGLRGHRFEYTDAAPGMNDGKRLGFIAQEVREILPQWVRLGSDGYYSVTPTGFEALAVEAMRELAEENVALHADNAALEQANVELREVQAAQARQLARIEARLDARAR
jgi:trimeric autotransporter adhesin